jgi:rhodanese-related sulfurtransferase
MATSAMVINVLARKYAEDCRIKGSISVPLEELERFVEKMPRETEIIVYCARYTCPKSREAWHKLKQLGFTNIRAYEGGTQEWRSKGLPTEGICEMPYLSESLDKQPKASDVETISAEDLVQLLPK